MGKTGGRLLGPGFLGLLLRRSSGRAASACARQHLLRKRQLLGPQRGLLETSGPLTG